MTLRWKAVSLHSARSILPLPVLFRTDRRATWAGKKSCSSRENCCWIWHCLCCGSLWQPCRAGVCLVCSSTAEPGWQKGNMAQSGMCLPEGAVCPEGLCCGAAAWSCTAPQGGDAVSKHLSCNVHTQRSPGLSFMYWLVVTWLIMDHFYSWLLGKLISLSTNSIETKMYQEVYMKVVPCTPGRSSLFPHSPGRTH